MNTKYLVFNSFVFFWCPLLFLKAQLLLTLKHVCSLFRAWPKIPHHFRKLSPSAMLLTGFELPNTAKLTRFQQAQPQYLSTSMSAHEFSIMLLMRPCPNIHLGNYKDELLSFLLDSTMTSYYLENCT